MRKLGMFLGFLGGFLVMLAILAKFYMPGQLARTPIDVDSTTYLSGTAALGADSPVPVKATSVTLANSETSTDDVVVFTNSSCLVKDEGDVPNCVSADDPEERLISASVDNFATDRKTALAVNDPQYLPADAEPHEGLVNKWPFDVEEKTYPVWDGTAGVATDAEFAGTEELEGHETYRFDATTEADIEVTSGVQGTYLSEKSWWVDPTTGSIIKQADHQERTDSDGNNFLTLDLVFTDEQVKNNVDDASSNASSLNLVRNTIPLVGFIVGIPALIIGVLLTLRRKQEPEEA